MNEIHLIYNPTSGKGSALEISKQIKQWSEKQPSAQFIYHETENVGHAIAITRDITSKGKKITILVLGGDGTISEVLNGINDFENTYVGILPYGSGNDFFKILNMDKTNPIALVDAYVNNPTVRKIDYLLINDKYRAINEAGLGMSAEVIAYRNKMKRFKPSTQYKIATVIRALFWKSFSYKVSVDKGEYKPVDSMWFTINNGNRVGGGMLTAPEAKIDDGLITISLLRPFNRFATLSVLTKCKKDKIHQLKKRDFYNCKEIDLEGTNMTLEYDGNLIEGLSHVNAKIVPNKLNLLVVRK